MVVGRTLGWQHIKSTVFDLQRQPGAYRFTGHGSGHGVGMCVIGSTRLAAQGKRASEILDRYFPGLRISTLGPRLTAPPPARMGAPPTPVTTAVAGDLLISLSDGDEGEHDPIARVTAAARNDLSRALGVPAPPKLVLRFHPTTDEYQRATGQPWFTSGTILNGEVHLPPLAALRERDLLEQTIRHELVHVMTDAALANRPVWVREGAAIYFAGERLSRPGVRADVRGRCPDESELLEPTSAGALSNAYARARACFARQIVAGRSWRDVR
jgi:stage II sporulation protein D